MAKTNTNEDTVIDATVETEPTKTAKPRGRAPMSEAEKAAAAKGRQMANAFLDACAGTNVVSDEDYDKAVAAIKESDVSALTKVQRIANLDLIRQSDADAIVADQAHVDAFVSHAQGKGWGAEILETFSVPQDVINQVCS